MEFDKVLSTIREVSGTQLNPEVVDAFFRLVEKGEIKATK
jgi:HD-GYP domain-containing protein (c-di-GMP phosphodiesterase class II)